MDAFTGLLVFRVVDQPEDDGRVRFTWLWIGTELLGLPICHPATVEVVAKTENQSIDAVVATTADCVARFPRGGPRLFPSPHALLSEDQSS